MCTIILQNIKNDFSAYNSSHFCGAETSLFRFIIFKCMQIMHSNHNIIGIKMIHHT